MVHVTSDVFAQQRWVRSQGGTKASAPMRIFTISTLPERWVSRKPQWLLGCVHPVNEAYLLWRAEENLILSGAKPLP